ncbi:MAG TPA: SpoIIE family protein phosphatase [Verrucomicrobiae bacterium]|nr:SpoIIE family protein phosphatase [Verrucomicrobiae bacterium]
MQSDLKILIIENEKSFSEGITAILRQASDTRADITVATSPAEGMARIKELPFDIAVMEVLPSDGAGLTNVSMIHEAGARVPIIVVGPMDDEKTAMEVVQAGAQDYLARYQLDPRWFSRSIRYAIERHRADMALLDAEEIYRGLFDHLIEGIFQTTSDGHYLMANTALARIYGYNTPQELMKSITDIGTSLYVQPDRRAEFVRLMREHDTISGFESQIYRKDGSVIWISENCRAVRDARGGVIYYEGTVEDITQRRDAEEKLRTSEMLYHSLVETMPQSIFRKDLRGRYTFANPQFCKTLGKKYEEVIGRTIHDFLPPEQAALREQNDQVVVESKKPFEAIEESHFHGGSITYLQVIKIPIFDAAGEVIGLQGMFWDITQQRLAAEKIRRANAELALSQSELRVKNLQMEDDLKMAAEIQLTMLPLQYPSIPRNAPQNESLFQFTHRYLPTGAVGGDFFSVTALSDSEVGVFICDVAGHGVRSALVTAMIRALVEELKFLAGDPGEFLTKLNSDLWAILKHTGTPMMTTAFYFVSNSTTGAIRYANAGHPKPLHVRRAMDKVEVFKNNTTQSQPALGLFEKARYQTSNAKLTAGDLVMLYTDGLYEVHASNEDLYNQEMLSAAVQKRLTFPPAQLFDELLGEIREFADEHVFDDDVCLLGMEYKGTRKS